MTEKKRYRHENKFFIDVGTYLILRQRLKAVMKPDPNGEEYRVTSLYFDDIYRTAYNDKISGVGRRKKFRIRVYNQSLDRISLEEKIKDGDYTCKKSVLLTEDEYRKMLSRDFSFLTKNRFSQTAGEDFLASTSMVFLKPAVVVDYIREAYVCAAGNVRLTFDKQLKTGLNSDIGDKNARFYDAFFDGEIILEVKFDSFLPEYIKELLSGLNLVRDTASKYVFCADKLVEVVGTDYLTAPNFAEIKTGKETTQCNS